MLDVPENELFSAYLDGELTADEQAEMDDLLNTSPAARQLLDELRTLSATLQSLPVVELNEDLSGRVLRAAERQVLSEPFEVERTKAGWGRDSAPRPSFARRMLRPRTIWWSGVAVAVAIFLALGDSNNRNQQPGGNDGDVAVDTLISDDSGISDDAGDRAPEVWAAEDFDPPTIAAADPPPEQQPGESPSSEEPSPPEQANDAQTMIADSDKPTGNSVAANQPAPEPVTTPDASPQVVKPGDQVLIVKCDVSEKAADGRVLGEILAKRKIARLNRTDTETGKLFVEVDLTPTQLRALLDDLKSRREHFAAVSVPIIPGAAPPRIPSAAREPRKITGTVRVSPATPGKVGATGNNQSLTGSASAAGDQKQRIQIPIGGRDATSKPGQQTEQPAAKPEGVKRPNREERKFRVRFELNVVAPPTPETDNQEPTAPSEQADRATKTEQ